MQRSVAPVLLGRGSRRGLGDNRQADRGPGTHSAGQVDGVVAVGAKRVGDGGGAAAGPAHHHDALVPGKLVPARVDLAHRDQDRLRRVPG